MVVRSSSTGASTFIGLCVRRLGCALTMLAFAAVASRASASETEALTEAEALRGTYVWVPPGEFTSPHDPLENGQPHILYLNRCTGGQTITAGWPDDSTAKRSGILYGTVHFPPFPFGDAAWADVVEHTRQIFAPFNIAVTDVDPSPVSHDAAIVCGSGALAGFHGAGGVAPFTCGVIHNPITFTFPESLGNHPRLIAEVIAQEAAHAWGLDHSYKCEDPMTYLSGCGPKTFQDGHFPCGEYSARSCQCGGATQNTFAHIMGLFGPSAPDLQAPSATITHPHHGQIFEVGTSFDITVDVHDDVGVTLVSLFVNGDLTSQDAQEPFGPWPVVDIPEGVYELQVEAVDASGKTGASDVVRIEVVPQGAVPDDGGDDGADTHGGGGPHPDDGGQDDDGVDDGRTTAGAGALPPGFGPDEDWAQGCACTARGSRRAMPLWIFVGLLCIARRRRRH